MKASGPEQKRRVRENLTEEELTIFDILTRPGQMTLDCRCPICETNRARNLVSA